MPDARGCGRPGCGNRTTHPSGHHRQGSTPAAGLASSAGSRGEDGGEDGGDGGDGTRTWEGVGREPETVWHPVWRPGGRVPIKDRNVTYRPTIPAFIAHGQPALAMRTLATAESAALHLRTIDEEGANGPAVVPLLRTESAASSKIEQIEVGQRYIGRALAGFPTGQRPALEVAANVGALRTALDLAAGDVTAGTFHAIHRRLLPSEAWTGTPRTVQNWVGGSDYSPRDARHVPPVPERVPALLDDLAAFVRRDDLPAVVQAAIAQAQFETIHPYVDGNGRVGRALAHLVLRRRGVVVHGIAPLSVAVLANRDRYFEDLAGYDRGEVEGFTRRFVEGAFLAGEASRTLSHEIAAIQEDWRTLPAVAQARSDATIRRLVEDLPAHPVCDTKAVADRYGVSTVAARNALEALVLAGVLDTTTAARNLRIYEAVEIFVAIEDLERTIRARVTR